jgi:hypothetical protein
MFDAGVLCRQIQKLSSLKTIWNTFQTNFLAPAVANLTTDLVNQGGRVIYRQSGLYSGQVLNLDGMMEQTTGSARKGFKYDQWERFQFAKVLSNCAFFFVQKLNRRLESRGTITNVLLQNS